MDDTNCKLRFTHLIRIVMGFLKSNKAGLHCNLTPAMKCVCVAGSTSVFTTIIRESVLQWHYLASQLN